MKSIKRCGKTGYDDFDAVNHFGQKKKNQIKEQFDAVFSS